MNERQRRRLLDFGILVALLASALTQAGATWIASGQAQPAAAPSLVPNPSFELLDGDHPAGWRRATFQRSAELAVDSVARTGERSVRISSKDGGDAGWTVIVPIRPYSKYRLSGWIKTDGLEQGTSRGALFNLHQLGRQQATQAVTGTRDWTEVTLEFDSEANDAIQINCLFGGWGRARGTAWYDDVKLEMLETRELNPAVNIEPAKPRAPLSPFIYGQFIEHLGRCIYGGIWAEMLEDRKFFYAIGAKESPWRAVGAPDAVTMASDSPFVGAHSPVIRSEGAASGVGLAQGALAIIGGKQYTGRIVMAGDPSMAPVRVSLVWGDRPSDRETIVVSKLDATYRTIPLAFRGGAATESGRLEIVADGKGSLRVGTVSLMPADNVEGFRSDVLALLRELNAPVYRWPGGNFVSGYNWRDGIGDRDRRPPRKNPAWQGVEHNDVGIHEFLALCRLIGTEPYIAVNSGLGDSTSAVDEVEYVNGPSSSPQGKVRAQNGRAEPFRCRYWSVGNEMYGDWQLGHMPLAEYVKRHSEFARAMRAKDPSIRIIAVGSVGAWDEAMLANCAKDMNLISEHFYCSERPGLLAHVSQIPREIRRIATAHRAYRKSIPALAGSDIRVALDEWNFWYGPHVYGELGTRYFLKDALGIAEGVHEYSRQSDIIFMANYAQTVNVIGAIKTSKTAAALETTGLVLKLYRAHFGIIPVEVTGAPEPLDVAAAWTADRMSLTVSVVNPTKSAQTLKLQIARVALPSAARLWRIAGDSEAAFNEPGKPPVVAIVETAGAQVSSSLEVPPLSISLYEIRRGGGGSAFPATAASRTSGPR